MAFHNGGNFNIGCNVNVTIIGMLSKNENHNIVHNDVVLDKQKLGRLQSSICDVFGVVSQKS